jgi:hypothetical protein
MLGIKNFKKIIMKNLKYLIVFCTTLTLLIGCKKDLFDDISFLDGASAPAKLSALYNITQDNTGLVTITPMGEGVTSFDIYYGDGTAAPVKVLSGKNTQHVYKEGLYKVKIVGYNITGKTTEATQDLTVSFRAPENLKVTLQQNGLNLVVGASATYETFFKVYFGDSSTANPVPFKSFIEGQTVTHDYAKAGTYIVKVIALSGGFATTERSDTIKVGKQIDLPVGFDDPNYDYTMSDFGGNAGSLANDPVVNTNKVMKVDKNVGAEFWAGTTIGTGLGFANKIALSANRTKMSVKVYSPAAGYLVRLKIEDHKDGSKSVETDAVTTVANAWETLVFDFSNQAAGTAPINFTNSYDKASIFFDFGNGNTWGPTNSVKKTFYFDDLILVPATVTINQISLPVSFDENNVNYTVTDFGNNATTDAVDPTSSSNKVKKTVKPSGAETWAGTTIGTPVGFSSAIPITSSATKMSVDVYSPAAGIPVRLKIEDHNNANHSVEAQVNTTTANGWETLVFDFSNPASGTAALNTSYTFDKASIFFDFGNAGSGKTFYWDNVVMGAPTQSTVLGLPLTFESSALNYAFTDFSGGAVTVVANPSKTGINTSAKVGKMVKGAGDPWAGSYITLDNPIDFSTTKTFKVKVYSPRVGAKLLLKVENLTDGNVNFEKEVATTKANEWEEITFDYSAINASRSYQKVVFIFDLGTVGDGSANFTYYFDDIKLN